MATMELREGMTISSAIVRQLTKKAIALNKALGDPTQIVRPNKAFKEQHAKRTLP
jgi:hypothetical protein